MEHRHQPFGAWREFYSGHWPLAILICLAATLLFADLGGDWLWSDEGDTAVLASNILRYGVPKAWDGSTFCDSDLGLRVNQQLVMVSHPWLQYYLSAISFQCFGESTFAARFPFAFVGLLTVPLLYFLVLRLAASKKAAVASAFFLTISVQFLLFSRQSRNYALSMFLVILLIWLFFRLKDRRHCFWFALTSIFIFHSNPSGLAPLAALGLLTLIYRPFAPYRRWYWLSMPVVALATLPWIWFAQAGYSENTTLLRNFGLLLPRLTQFLIECASVTPLVGVVVLFVWVWLRAYRRVNLGRKRRLDFQTGRQFSFKLFSGGERSFFVVAGAISFCYALLIALTQSRTEMFNYGLRYATPIIPLMMGCIGILIAKASRGSIKVFLAIVLVLGVTKLGRITPWTFVDQERTYFDGTVFSAMHVPQGWTNKLFRTALFSFAKELWRENRGTVANVCQFLKKNAAPKDIIITNYDWEPIYFHTRLRQGLKIMPDYPIYQAARKHELPNYVFSVEGARWLVWRWAWEGYRGYEWKMVTEALAASGAVLTKVATVKETTWENRPELHFHRYPNQEYKYGWFPQDEEPDAEIYRIDWPAR